MFILKNPRLRKQTGIFFRLYVSLYRQFFPSFLYPYYNNGDLMQACETIGHATKSGIAHLSRFLKMILVHTSPWLKTYHLPI